MMCFKLWNILYGEYFECGIFRIGNFSNWENFEMGIFRIGNFELGIFRIGNLPLISTKYIDQGYMLGVKFGKSGKSLIPGIISGKGSGNTYTLSISINYKDLIKNMIYNIDYRLVKEVSDIVYKKNIN